MEDEAPLLDLIQKLQPDYGCTRRWIGLLELHAEILQSHERGVHTPRGARSSPEGSPRPRLSTEDCGSASRQAAPTPLSARSTGSTRSARHRQLKQAPVPLSGALIGKPQRPGLGEAPEGSAACGSASAADDAAGPGSGTAGDGGEAGAVVPVDKSPLAPGLNGNSLPPQEHRLPARVVWAITLLIPVHVAIANNLIVWTDGLLLSWKFEVVQQVMSDAGIGAGAVLLAVLCTVFGLIASGLVATVAPVCAGSGLPEAKGFLNGNRIRGIFKVRVLVVRIIGIVLALSAGFPIGREGPMVVIGGTLGYGISHFLAFPWARHWVEVSSSAKERTSPALIVDEERFAHVKRVGFILGGAAGIATAFDAPIGGILYMFEEATMNTWPPELTFRAFVCTVCGALISRALFNLAGQDVHRLLIYLEEQEEGGSWDWIDVPFFTVLAACLGLLSAAFTRILVGVWACRQRLMRRLQKWQPYARIVECVLYCLLCALAFALVPLVVGCKEEPSAQPTAPMAKMDRHSLQEPRQEGLKLIRHSCPEGYFNEVATVFFKGAEGTVKHLLSRNTKTMHPVSLAVSLAVYTALAAGMAGLPVPMGNFLPSMLIGALGGRLVGEAVGGDRLKAQLGARLADAGVYALVGSAAMLSGFTHMTLAVVVILVEAAHDLSLVSPLMLSIFISHIVSTTVNRQGYDEALIVRKGVPFLEAELPREMDRHGLVAADLCEALPIEALLPPEATVASVQRALMLWEVTSFPIVAEGVCVGLTPRARLEAAMRARGAYLPKETAPVKVLDDKEETPQSPDLVSEEDDELDLDSLLQGLYSPMASRLGLDTEAQSEEATLPLHCIMDPSPYTLLEDMPAPRLYPLFTHTGTSVACVVSKRGEFRGVLSRVNLISAANSALRPQRPQQRPQRPQQTRPRRYDRLM